MKHQFDRGLTADNDVCMNFELTATSFIDNTKFGSFHCFLLFNN